MITIATVVSIILRYPQTDFLLNNLSQETILSYLSAKMRSLSAENYRDCEQKDFKIFKQINLIPFLKSSQRLS